MADNTGAYITTPNLIGRMYPSAIVTEKASITLSNKSGNVFEYTTSLNLEVGDIICQGDYAQTIELIETTPDRITLDDGTNIVDGSAYVYRSTKDIFTLEMYRDQASSLIDLYTGQWFNSREFTSSNPIKLEGINSPILHLPVPILTVTSLKVNNSEDELDVDYYTVFNGRALPDDRRNPRIKLIGREYNIFSNVDITIFYRGKYNLIEGTFGYLEPDGSTPMPIQWAVARLVVYLTGKEANNVSTTSAASGAIKREKTDLHEIEYDTSNQGANTYQNAPFTGDEEVDRIIKMFKSPLAMGGTFPEASVARKYFRDNYGVNYDYYFRGGY